jgi:hypothetical protein
MEVRTAEIKIISKEIIEMDINLLIVVGQGISRVIASS